jgi:hypothetical protein
LVEERFDLVGLVHAKSFSRCARNCTN